MNEITFQEFGNTEESGKIGYLKYRLNERLSSEELASVSTRKLPEAQTSAILDVIKMCPGATKKTIKAIACNIGFDVLMIEPNLIEYAQQRRLLQESKIGNTDKFIEFQNRYSESRLKNWGNQSARTISILKKDLEKLDDLELKLGLMKSDLTVIALEIGLRKVLDDLGISRSRVYEMLDEDVSEFMKNIERQIVILWITFREFKIDTVTRTIIFRDFENNNDA